VFGKLPPNPRSLGENRGDEPHPRPTTVSGKVTFGTLGAGQIPYWGAVLFNAMAGIDALEIQYKNPDDAVTDVITGRIDYYIAQPVVAIGGKDKLRMLAVTTRVRSEVQWAELVRAGGIKVE